MASAESMEALQIALGFSGQSKEVVQHSGTVSICHAQQIDLRSKFRTAVFLSLRRWLSFLFWVC